MENKDLTVYKNEMNTVCFRKFNAVELNLFFAICTQMRDKELETVTFTFNTLKKLSGYKSTTKKRFINDIKSTYDKLLTLSYYRHYINKKDHEIQEKFILFTDFSIDITDETIDISVNPKLKYILNQINNGFTKFDLADFTDLKSSYSKTIFRLLKQYRLTGYYKVHIDDFRALLDIPKSYRMSEINIQVLNIAFKELVTIFEDLHINKIKAKGKNKIEYLEFVFTPENDVKKDGTKIFRDEETGKYYENDLEHFTVEEAKKSFPECS